MPDESNGIISRYWDVRHRLEKLEQECTALDAELVEIEKLLSDDFDPCDDIASSAQHDA